MEENHEGKFGEEEGDWRSGLIREPYGVGVWKEIRKQWEFINMKISFKVGNESRVKFWKDRWCGEQPLCEIFLSLFTLSSSKEAWVADF